MSNTLTIKDIIQKIFQDIIPYPNSKEDPQGFVGSPLFSSNNPPSYILKMLLFRILNFVDYGVEEKSYWHTYFSYKKILFEMEDTKFGWSIRVRAKQQKQAEKFIKPLLNKINQASLYLDKCILKDITENTKGHLYGMRNYYVPLFSIYSFYLELIKTTLKNYEEIEKGPGNLDLTELCKAYNQLKKDEKEISNYSFSLIASFFSLSTCLMESFYIFQNPNIVNIKKLKQFSSCYWKDQFQKVLAINNPEIARMYNKLLGIQKEYRNPLLHGILGDKEYNRDFLVSIPNIGFAPFSYTYLNSPVYSSNPISIDPQFAKVIVDSFSNFIEFLNKKKPYKSIILYLQYGFIIPLDRNELNDLKKQMANKRQFKQYLNELANTESNIANRE